MQYTVVFIFVSFLALGLSSRVESASSDLFLLDVQVVKLDKRTATVRLWGSDKQFVLRRSMLPKNVRLNSKCPVKAAFPMAKFDSIIGLNDIDARIPPAKKKKKKATFDYMPK